MLQGRTARPIRLHAEGNALTALLLLFPILGSLALVGIALWIERAVRRPGLSFLIFGSANPESRSCAI
jgi:hypothetical protein